MHDPYPTLRATLQLCSLHALGASLLAMGAPDALGLAVWLIVECLPRRGSVARWTALALIESGTGLAAAIVPVVLAEIPLACSDPDWHGVSLAGGLAATTFVGTLRLAYEE